MSRQEAAFGSKVGLNAGSKQSCWATSSVCAAIASSTLMSYQSTDRRSRRNHGLSNGDWMTMPAVQVLAVSGVRSGFQLVLKKPK